jgi:hypothetical protein
MCALAWSHISTNAPRPSRLLTATALLAWSAALTAAIAMGRPPLCNEKYKTEADCLS